MHRFQGQTAVAIKSFFDVLARHQPGQEVESVEQVALASGVWSQDDGQLPQRHFGQLERLIVFNSCSANHRFMGVTIRQCFRLSLRSSRGQCDTGKVGQRSSYFMDLGSEVQ